MKKYYIFFLSAMVLLPQISFGAISCDALENDTFAEIIAKVICIINNALIPVIFSIATLVFLIGVVKFVANGADEEGRKKGKEFMIWGLISFVVMVSIWGIIRLVTNTFKLDSDTSIVVPEAPVYTP